MWKHPICSNRLHLMVDHLVKGKGIGEQNVSWHTGTTISLLNHPLFGQATEHGS
jgi:hypothetical protein